MRRNLISPIDMYSGQMLKRTRFYRIRIYSIIDIINRARNEVKDQGKSEILTFHAS